MDQALLKLVEFVENASPVVWGIVLRQVNADIVENAIWLIALITISILGVIFGKKCWIKKDEGGYSSEETWGILSILLYVASVGCSIGSVGTLATLVKMLYNPQFYAINYLISSLR